MSSTSRVALLALFSRPVVRLHPRKCSTFRLCSFPPSPSAIIATSSLCRKQSLPQQNRVAALHRSAVALRKVPVPNRGTAPPIPMSMEDCEQRVIKAIKAWDRFPQDRADLVTLDARFVEDLSFDSLDLVEITLALEQEFQYEEIPDEVAQEFKTPRDVVNYVADMEMVLENEGI